MYNEFVEVFHTWSGILQFLFIIIFSFFLTMIVNKILDVFGTFFSTIPIIIHGWPDKTDIVNADDEEDEKEETAK